MNAFVSYAQNFEDLYLHRALAHVTKGFYVDIGAQDPVIDSVSFAFYAAGWRGIHCEPISYYAQKLREARPDEEVLEVAVTGQPGPITFYACEGSGLSTGDRAIAKKNESQGWQYTVREVRTLPLSALLDRVGERDIHWLKIDVEGMELAVIDSWAPSPARPWIVLVESTLPNSQVSTHSEWEPSLLKLDYDYVYFDGINRYYVSRQHHHLKPFFGAGPNIFDNFVLRAGRTGFEYNQLAAQKHELEMSVKALRDRALQLEQSLDTIYSSRSWRITAPLRSISRFFSQLGTGIGQMIH